MKPKILIVALLGMLSLSGCAALVGAGAIVAVDEAKEREEGGDGLI